jgi:endonuclease/exonuclease/phosphatase (EEP) superfamily protein YafD
MENRRAADALRMLSQADPDVICLLETDAWWEEQMRPLERDYPHTNRCPIGNTYGMLLYSRLPLARSETRFLVQEDIPSMRSVVRLHSGEEIVLHTVHPRPPIPPEPSYGRDAELVLIGREMEREQRPAIVLGDLNDVAWSYTTTLFQRISGALDPRIGRGLYNSFHAKSPVLRFPLDHVFHTPDFALVDLRRLDRCGSDHFPILIELAYEPSAVVEQDAPEEEPGDRENARELLEDAVENGAVTSAQSPLAEADGHPA